MDFNDVDVFLNHADVLNQTTSTKLKRRLRSQNDVDVDFNYVDVVYRAPAVLFAATAFFSPAGTTLTHACEQKK